MWWVSCWISCIKPKFMSAAIVVVLFVLTTAPDFGIYTAATTQRETETYRKRIFLVLFFSYTEYVYVVCPLMLVITFANDVVNLCLICIFCVRLHRIFVDCFCFTSECFHINCFMAKQAIVIVFSLTSRCFCFVVALCCVLHERSCSFGSSPSSE